MRYLLIALLYLKCGSAVGQTDVQKLELSVIEQYISWQDERDKNCVRLLDLEKEKFLFDPQKEAHKKMLEDWERHGADISAFLRTYKKKDVSSLTTKMMSEVLLKKVRIFKRYFSIDKGEQRCVSVYSFSRMIFLNNGKYCVVRIYNGGRALDASEGGTFLLKKDKDKWEILQRYDGFHLLGG